MPKVTVAKKFEFAEALLGGWGLLLVVSAPEGIKLPSMASVGQETFATKIRVPGGNFRLLARLLTQIERILKINDFNYVTRFVVETPRETLVIGSTQPHLSWNNSPKIIGKISHTQTQL